MGNSRQAAKRVGRRFCCTLLLLVVIGGRLPGEETVAEKIKRLEEKLTDSRGRERVDLLNELSGDYRSVNITKALEKGWESRKIAHAISYAFGEAAADVQLCMGYIYQGSPSRAVPFGRKAMELYTRLADEKGIAQSLNLLGNVFIKQGRCRKALGYYFDSLKFREKIGDQKGVISCLNNIGTSYNQLNQFGPALPFYQKARRLAMQLGNKEQLASILCNLGVTYDHLAQYEQALECYQQSLSLKEELGDRHGTAIALNDIGGIYHTLADLDRALDYYQRSLALLEESSSQDVTATVLYSIGAVYEELGQYAKTLVYYQKAYRLARGAADRYNAAYYQLYIGKCFASLGNFSQAEKELRQALAEADSLSADDLRVDGWLAYGEMDMARQRYDDALRSFSRACKLGQGIGKHAIVWKALFGIGRAQEKKNNFIAAKDAYLRSLAAIEDIRTQQQSEEFCTGVMEPKIAVYESLVSLLVERGRPADLPAAFACVERAKARSFLDLLLLRKMGSAGASQIAVHSQPLALAAVQRMLDVDTKLVEYFVTTERVYLFLVGRQEFRVQALEISRRELQEKIRRLRQPIADYEARRLDFAHLYFDLETAHELYQKLVAPVQKQLRSKRLIIVPDDALYFLPFEALVVDFQREPPSPDRLFSEYENAAFLLDGAPISYAFSASMLDPRWTLKPRGPLKVLAFSNPDLGSDLAPAGTDSGLSQAAAEVSAIRSLLGDDACTVYTGRDARESILKREAGKYEFIHIATHGIAVPANPLRSRLYFSQPDAAGEDGILYAQEIYGLRLNCQLVVLDACETGLGGMKRGEGLISLARTFLFAGAMHVVCSLWSVEEESYPLMPLFYSNLKAGLMPAEALQRAKREFKKTRAKLANGVTLSHSLPYLWAPAILLVR